MRNSATRMTATRMTATMRTAPGRPAPREPAPTISRRALGGTGAAVAGTLALAACSNEGRGGADGGDNADVALPAHIPFQGVQPDLPGKDGSADGFLRYPEKPEKVTDGSPGDGEDFGIFAMTNSPAPPAMGENEYWQEMNSRLGCTMKVSVVPTNDFADRFQTAVAGDQLPEIFAYFPTDVPSLPSMLAERAADLTSLLSGDAVKDYPFLANIPTESWRSCVYGGKIYAVPIPRGGRQSSVLYARTDLLEKQGLDPAIGSLDDFTSLCRELTGGKRWAIGSAPTQFVREMFEIANGWKESGGSLTSALEDERQQDALEAVRSMVSDGLLHPDAFSVDDAKRKTWTANGTTPLMWGTFTAWPYFFENPGMDAGLWLETVQPPRAEGGGDAAIWHGLPFQNITSIGRKAEDRAAALLEVIDYFSAPFGSEEYTFKKYGIEGVDHELKGADPVRTQKGLNETAMALEYVGNPPLAIYSPGDEKVTRTQYQAEADAVPTAVVNPVNGLYSQTESRKGNQIGEKLTDVENDIIQGRRPVSAWADAVATWKKDGGDAMRDEYEKALSETAGG
jgi:putative aldouronate transport system substrate-binding protein